MCAMYHNHVATTDYNLSIDGFDIVAETISPNESFNRRETARKGIIGGTQTVIRTNYIVRDFTVNCHFMIDPLYPDVYDNIFREWQSKPVEVICKEMGGKFNAECTIKKSVDKSPQFLKVDIQLVEIPSDSLIPNDTFKLPSDKDNGITFTKSSKKASKNNNSKTSNKKDNKKKKSSKNSKKKSKGSNITKTKKNK